jgi:hypothetical protein
MKTFETTVKLCAVSSMALIFAGCGGVRILEPQSGVRYTKPYPVSISYWGDARRPYEIKIGAQDITQQFFGLPPNSSFSIGQQRTVITAKSRSSWFWEYGDRVEFYVSVPPITGTTNTGSTSDCPSSGKTNGEQIPIVCCSEIRGNTECDGKPKKHYCFCIVQTNENGEIIQKADHHEDACNLDVARAAAKLYKDGVYGVNGAWSVRDGHCGGITD